MNKKSILYRYSGYLFLAPYLLLFCVFLVAPLCYGLGLSFFEWEMISPFPPRFNGLENYQEALKDQYFWKALWATARFVIMIVPTVICGALLVATLINALPLKRQAIFRASFFFPTLISISVAGILWRWFFNTEFGLFNAVLANFSMKVPWLSDIRWAMKSIAFMTFWWTLGGPMVVLLAGLNQIPDHYYEAAAIDGANAVQRFIHITIPLLRPVLLFVSVMSIIGSFQVFGQTFMITRGGPEFSTRVLVQYIYETAFSFYRMGYGAAMSWLLFLVIAVFSIVQFRIMRER
ncbi:sugar ABC transporter permease [Candidatus Sumerlaeota bacterium]|nr:sugar ABC transporter permease [Candidatus Sumerlaeota bacterium]